MKYTYEELHFSTMEWLQLAVFTVAIALLHTKQVASESACKLIVALPSQYDSEPIPSWERGLEIFSDVRIVSEKIRNISKRQLNLTEVKIGHCGAAKNFGILFEHIFLSSAVQLMNSTQCLGIVGLSCNDAFHAIIQPSPSIHESLKVGIETALIPSEVKPAATQLVRALIKLMKSLNWQKLGIITETDDTYFSRTADTVYKEAKNDPDIDIITFRQLQVNERVRSTRNASKITFVSASLKTTSDILCSAYEQNAVWPVYIWILHSYFLEDVIEGTKALCSISKALENVIFIRRTMSNIVRYHHGYEGQKESTNPYSIVIKNLVWTTAQTLLQLEVNNYDPTFLNIIEVIQIRNSTELHLVDINDSHVTFLDDNIKEVVIADEFDVLFEGASTGYTIIFSITIAVGAVFVTIMLIGYIYFRKEAEVKSTSFVLSLLIFFGCYLNLIFMSFLLYFHQPILISENILNAICGILPWISGLGISITLIIATLFVKLARVYHIFNRASSNLKPIGKQCSDILLAGYVLLILLPMIVILITWMMVDRYKITYQPSSQYGFIQKQCLSNHLSVWLPLLVLYVVSLFIALVTIAIRSRKIRQEHFKDTKKVNMFIFCLFFDILLPLSFWWLLGNLGTSVPYYIAAIPLHLGHFGIVLLCQLLLIAPKLAAPFSRCLKYQKMNSSMRK